LVQAARAVITCGPFILLPHEAAEWKKILSGLGEILRQNGLGLEQAGQTPGKISP